MKSRNLVTACMATALLLGACQSENDNNARRQEDVPDGSCSNGKAAERRLDSGQQRSAKDDRPCKRHLDKQ